MKKTIVNKHSQRIAFAVAIAGLCRFSPQAAHSQTAPATPPPAPKWESSAALGLALTRGNSDTLLFNANIGTFRKWEHDELRLGADGTYGETDGTTSAQQAHGFGQLNHLFNDRFYGGLRLDALHDHIADLNYRFTVAPLAGYYFIKETNTTLSAEVGPGFVFERQGGNNDTYTSLRIGERFEHKFNARAKMWQTAEFLPQLDSFSNYLLLGEIGVEASLTEKLSLRVVLQDSFDNEPAPGRKKNDLKLISGLSYKF